MAWRRLTVDDLRMSLAEEEIEKLATLSLDPEKVNVIIQETLDMVADAFRGAWASKGYTLDVRPWYVAPEYVVFILAYCRWVLWTRMPMTEDYALSEPRKLLLEEAQELLKNPYIGTSKPDYSDDPELSAQNMNTGDAAITVPWLRFPPIPGDTGFPTAYWPRLARGLSAWA